MIVETSFSKEMLEVLAGMKGKTFKSFECVLNSGDGWMSAAGNVRLNMGKSSIDLQCFPHDVVIRGNLEEMPYFTCKEVEPDCEFVPYVIDDAKAYLVGERITGVYVVSDLIEVAGHDDGMRLNLDVAVAVKTSSQFYTFSRGIWFDEEIDIRIADDIAVPYSTDECDSDWTDDPDEGDSVATTTRTTKKLA